MPYRSLNSQLTDNSLCKNYAVDMFPGSFIYIISFNLYNPHKVDIIKSVCLT